MNDGSGSRRIGGPRNGGRVSQRFYPATSRQSPLTIYCPEGDEKKHSPVKRNRVTPRMRSQVRFVMHPDDEREFVDDLLRDDSVGLINGPRWKTSEPAVYRSLESIDTYCIIWSKKDLAQLDAEFIPESNDWYCRSESATIQFLRSCIYGSVLTEGRLAVGTNSEPIEIAQVVDERYRKLRKFIKKRYRNNMLRWRNPTLPVTPTTAVRSSNPSRPDSSVWIGLAALNWLEADPERRVKQWTSSIVEGELALETAMGAPVSGRS